MRYYVIAVTVSDSNTVTYSNVLLHAQLWEAVDWVSEAGHN
jgi:hypothetical protein